MGATEAFWMFSLRTIHCIVWLRQSLVVAVAWVWTGLLHAMKHKGTKLECIRRDAKQLKKIPLHLALVVHEDELSHSDLANLVVWAFSAGVHNVSLYDPNGELKNHLLLLRNAIVTQHQRMFSPPVPEVIVATSQDLAHHGNSQGSSYLVLVLSPEDGRQDMVATATSICRSIVQRQLSVESVNTSLVDNRISVTSRLPEPDLAIVCGSTSSTLGFPPWLMRLTEILSLPSHHKVSYQAFHDLLWRYSKCQRRLGK